MAENPALLVVDDEEVVCQACRRIFSRQGFQVEVNTDARRGLAWATEKDYAIILLDIKMPNMDGIQFLQQLRQKKPDVPVLIITGYPSIPNASAVMRLGACDYITKPFTSEEITRAVQRVLATRRADNAERQTAEATEPAASAAEALFWEEAWLRLEADGSACVGAVLPGLHAAGQASVRLPRIGEAVYQGLPLAGVTVPNQPTLLIPSPVSGIVVAVNDDLPEHSDWLSSDPCGQGWIACICTTRYEEVAHCKRRQVLLVNANLSSTEEQLRKLTALGCHVDEVPDRDELLSALQSGEERAIFLDAASLGDAGPALAGLINDRAPSARVVVVAAPGGTWEAAYRKHKIFYYAVEPFADDEIADILTAVFRTHEPSLTKAERQKGPSEPISSIAITNRKGHKVQLLAAPGLLWRHEGLGCQIGGKLLGQMFPVVITPGEANLTPANILKTAAVCDRLMVLLAHDCGLLPGGLARDTKPDFDIDPGEAAGRVTKLAVQPDKMGGLADLDARTTAALADHIVQEMASY